METENKMNTSFEAVAGQVHDSDMQMYGQTGLHYYDLTCITSIMMILMLLVGNNGRRTLQQFVCTLFYLVVMPAVIALTICDMFLTTSQPGFILNTVVLGGTLTALLLSIARSVLMYYTTRSLKSWVLGVSGLTCVKTKDGVRYYSGVIFGSSVGIVLQNNKWMCPLDSGSAKLAGTTLDSCPDSICVVTPRKTYLFTTSGHSEETGKETSGVVFYKAVKVLTTQAFKDWAKTPDSESEVADIHVN